MDRRTPDHPSEAGQPAPEPFARQALVDLFARYDSPLVNITAACECRDFVTPAKALGLPPFALVLHAVACASLDVEPFRHRLLGGRLSRVADLTVSYTVVGADGNLNFSTFAHDPDRAVFLARYLEDREPARTATGLRLAPMETHDYLFVTCLPWMRFTAIQHPVARFADCSIPSVAAGRFAHHGGRVDFPMAVQAHHGLVDGLHIHRLITRTGEILDGLATELDHG